MAYFPFFADIQGKEAVVVGGGKIACRRILSLLPFGCRVRVIAPEIGPELKAVLDEEKASGRLLWENKEYEERDLDACGRPAFVLAASGNLAVNEAVVLNCRARGIAVNGASKKENCDFYFPGLARRGGLVAGVTASGTDHKKAAALAAAVRKLLEDDVWAEENSLKPGEKGSEPDGVQVEGRDA